MFEIFRFSSFFIKKNIIFTKVSLPHGEQIIIQMQILRGNCCLKNESEQIYLFLDLSSWKSYQLTQMSANLRNCTFSEISDPGAECFAPIWKFPFFLDFHKKWPKQNYFRKSVAIFRWLNNYLNEEYRRYLQRSKWVWTDLFVLEYF